MPNQCFVSPGSTSLALRHGVVLCLAALAVIGCGSGGSGLEDTARNISRRSSQKLENAGQAGAGAEDDAADAQDEGVAGEGDDAADEMADDSAPSDPTPNGSSAPDGRKLATEPVVGAMGPAADDSVRCGDGVLDLDELCDITIETGEEGACPVLADCPMFDACHAPKLEVRGCWTQCVLGAQLDECM